MDAHAWEHMHGSTWDWEHVGTCMGKVMVSMRVSMATTATAGPTASDEVRGRQVFGQKPYHVNRLYPVYDSESHLVMRVLPGG
jgi:hypothetical protein